MNKKHWSVYHILVWMSWVLLGGMVLVACHFLRRAYIADQFVIPSDSMLPQLQPGDRILVNKLIIGARIYDEFIFGNGHPLKSHRVKGWRKIQHNDILVFNFPINRKQQSIEFRLNYVYAKRSIGLPGDTVSIRGGYFHSSTHSGPLGDTTQQRRLSQTENQWIAPNVLHAMPFDSAHYGWTIKEFGPLYVPKKGDTITLDSINWKIYQKAVEYETGQKQTINPSKSTRQYVFTKNYYFMCGDNVLDSNDSRYWGFVPEEFIVGVVSHITYSQSRSSGKLQWNRLLKNVLKE